MDKKTILIVEDDGILATHMQDMLVRLGYTALAPAATGEAAIEVVKAQPPDLVLMDIKLGGEMDGITAAGLIQSIANVPIVYLSGYSQDPLLQQAKVTEPYGYLVKPVVERELAATIEMALYKHTLDRRLRESEEKHRLAMEATSDGLWDWNIQTGAVYFSPAWGRILGLDSIKPEYTSWESRLHPEDRDSALASLQAHLEGKAERWEKEHRLQTASGAWKWVLGRGRVVARDRDGKPLRMLGTMIDTTERKRAEEALREREERYRTLLETMEEGYFEVDLKGNFTLVNDSLCKMFNASSKDDLIGLTNRDYMSEETARRVYKIFQQMYNTGQSAKLFEWEVIKKDGTKGLHESSVYLIRNARREVIGFRGIVRDITDRKKTEEALRKSEEEAKRLAQENAVMAEIGRIISSTLNIEEVYERFAAEARKFIPFDRIVVSLNNPEEATATVAYASGLELEGRKIGEVYSLPHTSNEEVVRTRAGLLVQPDAVEELEGRFSALILTFRAGLRSMMSIPLISRNQVIGALHLRSKKPKAYNDRDLKLAERIGAQIAGAIANAQLFLERTRAEEHLKASLKEKEVLLREIHHRVKNNLQVISSLLRLQSRTIKDDAICRVFKESQDRVKTMAIIHEKLYQSTDLAGVDFAGYIRDLTANLYRSYGVSQETISLRIQAQNVFLGINMAIPCGLIINELVSNCLKHAFPGGERGEIYIDLSSDHDQIILTVGDNGGAFPKGLDFRNTESLGLQLVLSLIEQLEGAIELHSDGKTEFRIAFPARHNK